MGRVMQHAYRDAVKRDKPERMSPFAYKGHWLAIRSDGRYEICWKNERSGKVTRRNTGTLALEEAKRRLKMFVQGNRTFPAHLQLENHPPQEQNTVPKDIVEIGSPAWLRARLRSKSLRVSDLAKDLGMKNIYSWTNSNGKGVPKSQLGRVCEYFGIEPPADAKSAKPHKSPRAAPPQADIMPTPEQAFLNFKRSLIHHCQTKATDDVDTAIARLEVVKAFDELWVKECQKL